MSSRSSEARPSEARSPTVKLSLCISTLNRAEFLRQTLDSVLPQLTQGCELLVVDNASSDDTHKLFDEPRYQHPRLRYLKMQTNHGLDANFDRAIELARGEYCWPLPDDDLLKPGAIATVCKALETSPSAVLVNYEIKNFAMSKILQTRVLDFDTDRVYGAWESSRMFVELGDFIRYIGALIIKRDLWLERDRTLYAGSLYGFVGMVYQAPFPASVYVIAEPCVSYRCGNVKTFEPLVMEIALARWPSLVASLPFPESAKRKLHSAHPWRHLYDMLFWRGSGYYAYPEYRRWIRPQVRSPWEKFLPFVCAFFPRLLANTMLVTYLARRGQELRQLRGFQRETLRSSPYHIRSWSRRLGERIGLARGGAVPARKDAISHSSG
jgi:abequosyltransferase